MSILRSAKLALLHAKEVTNLNNCELARLLKCDEKAVRRMLDLNYPSKISTLEEALLALGLRLELVVK